MARNWTPDSWKGFSAAQQPDWPDSADLDRVLKEISGSLHSYSRVRPESSALLSDKSLQVMRFCSKPATVLKVLMSSQR